MINSHGTDNGSLLNSSTGRTSLIMDKGSLHESSTGRKSRDMDYGSLIGSSTDRTSLIMDKGRLHESSTGRTSRDMDYGSLIGSSTDRTSLIMDKGSLHESSTGRTSRDMDYGSLIGSSTDRTSLIMDKGRLHESSTGRKSRDMDYGSLIGSSTDRTSLIMDKGRLHESSTGRKSRDMDYGSLIGSSTDRTSLIMDKGSLHESSTGRTSRDMDNDNLHESSTEPAAHTFIDEDIRATVQHTNTDELMLDEEQDNVETNRWPRNIEEKAGNNTSLNDYRRSYERHGHTQSKTYRKSAGDKKSVKTPHRQTDYRTDNKLNAFFKEHNDAPVSMGHKRSSHNRSDFRKNKNATTNSNEEHGKSFSFKDNQASFVRDRTLHEAAAHPENDAKDDLLKHPHCPFSNEFSKQTVKPNKTNSDVVSSSKVTSGRAHSSFCIERRLKETTKTLGALILKEGLVVKDVCPDGNCLFAAIVDQLHVRGEFYFSTRSLREAAVKYLTEHPCQEDGTPLKHFLTEQDGTWENYLARMNCDGEWGDHFVINALANVLQRRLIIMRGLTELIHTIIEPSKGGNFPDTKTTGKNPSGTSARQDVSEGGLAIRQDEHDKAMSVVDDLYLGHIAQSHYVSLRYYNWPKQFHDSLRRRSLPSFLYYNQCHQIEPALPDGSQEEKHMEQQTFPEEHLNFLLRSIQTAELFTCKTVPVYKRSMQSPMCSTFWVGNDVCGLNTLINGLNILKETNKHDPTAHLYVATNDTIVLTRKNKEETITQKDLVAMENDCPPGFTLLAPVEESLWTKATVKMNGKVYLKHIFYGGDRNFNKQLTFAFKSKWPNCSDEFLVRHRPHGWPTAFQMQAIQKYGACVVPKTSKASKYPAIEWKFSFKQAETILCAGMAMHVKHVYYFLTVVHNFFFKNNDYLNGTHLKAVFFYTCEELPQEEFCERPWRCLLYMLRKLQKNLEERFLPDYFVREDNLMANMEESVLLWHLAPLEWIQNNAVEGLFLFLERYAIMELFGLRKYFETLITDAQKFVKHHELSISYRECFLPLSIASVKNLVTERKFVKATDLCESIFEECTGYFDAFDGPKEILLKVLEGLPLQDQWLFAFYMDLMIGSYLLESVYTERKCVPLTTYFGEGLIQELHKNSAGPVNSLSVPVIILYNENLVDFAFNFANVLLDIDKQSFKAAAHFFLKNFTNEVLQDIAQQNLNGDYHTGHTETKRKLYEMFMTLYDRYNRERAWLMFEELMEMYDLLSQHYQQPSLKNHVAILWDYYRKIQRSSV